MWGFVLTILKLASHDGEGGLGDVEGGVLLGEGGGDYGHQMEAIRDLRLKKVPPYI